MRTLLSPAAVFLLILSTVKSQLPKKIYGVNLGSWLLLESWMLPEEWVEMGGEICGSCDTCIATEFAFVKAHGQEYSDEKFAEHWSTWFTQDDVDQLVNLKINTVRIPLGYWIVEELVHRDTEHYPKHGLSHLRRGLKQLKEAGIAVILDHHALPGVAAENQQFAGNCTSNPQFYTPYNYHRALVWTAVMAALSHIDPAFCSVVSIEAMNEPLMNATKTPGYGDFQKQFVEVVRLVEFSLGIPLEGHEAKSPAIGSFNLDFASSLASNLNITSLFSPEASFALLKAIPILLRIASEIQSEDGFELTVKGREPLITMFSDINWQYDSPANPADAAIGPQYYDNHLYYSYGGVADSNEEAYLIHVCNLKRIENDFRLQNTPLLFGEWALPTEFNATDEFLYKWADAQKYQYGRDAGWIFWNFKIEISELANDIARQWSYYEGVNRGYLTKDPTEFNDLHICEPYFNKTYIPPTPAATLSLSESMSALGSSAGNLVSPTAAVYSSAQLTQTSTKAAEKIATALEELSSPSSKLSAHFVRRMFSARERLGHHSPD